MAKKEKQSVYRVQMTEGKKQLIRQLLQEYDIESAQDIQEALKDLLGGTGKEMMITRWNAIWVAADPNVSRTVRGKEITGTGQNRKPLILLTKIFHIF